MNIDTLSIARDLKAAELPAGQAEAIGRSVTDSVASKSDLELTRTGLEAKIEQVRTEIERARNQVLLGVVSSQIVIAGIVIAIIRL